MESLLVTVFTVTLMVFAMPVYGQITNLCTGAMLRSFNPCMNFVTNPSGSSPTQDCCTALKYLMGNGTNCLCLIATGGVPFQVPVNRSLAMSLPKACKMSGVPVECKASATPLPAPGPDTSDSPFPSPGGTLSPPLSPDGNTIPGQTPPGMSTPGDGSIPGLSPPDDLTPPLTPPGTRPTLSAAHPSQKLSPILLLPLYGTMALKYY